MATTIKTAKQLAAAAVKTKVKADKAAADKIKRDAAAAAKSGEKQTEDGTATVADVSLVIAAAIKSADKSAILAYWTNKGTAAAAKLNASKFDAAYKALIGSARPAELKVNKAIALIGKGIGKRKDIRRDENSFSMYQRKDKTYGYRSFGSAV